MVCTLQGADLRSPVTTHADEFVSHKEKAPGNAWGF